MSSLCQACRAIGSHFFTSYADRTAEELDRILEDQVPIPHWSVEVLEKSASKGCPLCKILLFALDTESLSDYVRQHSTMWLLRQRMEPYEDHSSPAYTPMGEVCESSAFNLCAGSKVVSRGRFFIITKSWRSRPSIPIAMSRADEISLGATWLSDCIRDHPNCAKDTTQYTPNRLLKLNSFDECLDIQLVEFDHKDEDQLVSYATLSHCWGTDYGSKPLTMNADGIAAMQQRISFDDLPKSYQDAVQFTRALQINYLWIDSLCIVQDSAADCEKEISLMRNIYAGSILTLAAASSTDSSGGCRRSSHKSNSDASQQQSYAIPYYDLDLDQYKVRWFGGRPLLWRHEYQSAPLQQRAWVLQERFLSKRILYFCNDLMLWECKSCRLSSNIPWMPQAEEIQDTPTNILFNSAHESRYPYDLSERSSLQPAHDCDPFLSLELRYQWFVIVEQYSRRRLSKISDRFIALDGLKQAQTHPLRGCYIAGLWQSELPSALLWQIEPDNPIMWTEDQKLVLASLPSWSWASSTHSVVYDSQKCWQPNLVQKNGRREEEYNFGTFRIRGVDVQQEKQHHIQQYFGGSISCTGTLHRFHCRQRIRPDMFNVGSCLPLYHTSKSIAGIIYVDAVHEVFPYDHIFFLSVRREVRVREGRLSLPPEAIPFLRSVDWLEEDMCMGIGVVPEDLSLGKYRRVGLVRFVHNKLVENDEAFDFTLV